ncbi:MAG: amidase [Myxococcota bacterium]
MNDYAECDATELAARVARGETTPSALVDRAIASIEAVNGPLNAVVHRMYDEARATAAEGPPDGPFRGVPMVVKDFDGFVRGVPYTASTRFMDGWVPDHDSEAIARLRRAGFVFVAKASCPELAILGTTEPAWRGPTRNPWNPDHSTGGSSGGPAALVAARAVPIGHGGDGGGSLRIPASNCGLVGLKCTRGRVPLGPDQGEAWGGYVQWGGMTRSVRDTAALIDVMAGPMPGDPYAAPPLARPLAAEVGADPGKLRIGFSARSLFGRDIHPENVAAVKATANRLAALGHHVEEAAPKIDRDRLVRAYLTQVAVGIAGEVEAFGRWRGITPTAASFEPATWFLVQLGRTLPAIELEHAREAIHDAARATGRFHATYDLFLCASAAYPPVRIGELALKASERIGLAALRAAPVPAILRRVLDALAETNLEKTPNTQLFNQTGQPAISLPLHTTADGLPVGIQLAGRLGDEATLIRVAAQLEAAHPWRDRRPPICA